jgi:phosphatidylserine/phosphatidylglycerophosphate/cardiolipin synthase-like enzyme
MSFISFLIGSFLVGCCLLIGALIVGCSFTGNVVRSTPVPAEAGSIEAHQCPVENCSQVFREAIESSTTVDCALYDLSDRDIMDALTAKHARIAIDASTYFGMGRPVHTNGIMHDKFCILDSRRVLTGSYNPTALGEHHANNIVIIESTIIAKNYQDEFDELWKDVPQAKKKQVKVPKVNVTPEVNMTEKASPAGTGSGIIVEDYFCPEDHCESHVLAVLQEAGVSVHFMTYAFTSDPIGEYLASRSDLDIKGVFEKQQLSQWSEDKRLKDAGIPVKIDERPYLMHHKVFIIDGKTVITGSFNPSRNADQNNDENVVVIRDAGIAEQYEQEFLRLFDEKHK